MQQRRVGHTEAGICMSPRHSISSVGTPIHICPAPVGRLTSFIFRSRCVDMVSLCPVSMRCLSEGPLGGSRHVIRARPLLWRLRHAVGTTAPQSRQLHRRLGVIESRSLSDTSARTRTRTHRLLRTQLRRGTTAVEMRWAGHSAETSHRSTNGLFNKIDYDSNLWSSVVHMSSCPPTNLVDTAGSASDFYH